MARPRSEEKQDALFEAALKIVAVEGISARTASIAKLAGVAEGTLFRYFATKEVLLNALYLHLKQNLSDAMRMGFAAHAPLERQARSLWDGYIDWGVKHPSSVKALSQLGASEIITAETRAKADRIFPEVQFVSKACAAKVTRVGHPAEFTNTIFLALADATMQFAAGNPRDATTYKAAGFKIFWDGLSQ